MKEYYYDFHIHTCLSPCGDDDMTPLNIVNMSVLKGLDIIAITDHNTAGNCGAVINAAKGKELLVIPGMELETAEEIHIICLFNSVENALRFEDIVAGGRLHIKNRQDIYGRQILMDESDNVMGEEEELLITASSIGIYDVPQLVESLHGCAFPAHIDSDSHSVTAMLGALDRDMRFGAYELSTRADIQVYTERYPGYRILRNSDSHYLWQMSERENCISLSALTAEAVINCIKDSRFYI